MAAPFAKGFSTAAKRARSQESLAPVETVAASDSTKIDDGEAISEIPQFLRQTRADISTKFIDIQWQETLRISHGRRDPASKWAQTTYPDRARRNRYFNVLPWDCCRVHLQVADGTSDYINASHISLHDPTTGTKTAYIATQGPTKHCLDHFWHMIWHETDEVAVIVMLTPTEESGREKCTQYFPLESNPTPFKFNPGAESDGGLSGEVSLVQVSSHYGANTTVRELTLTVGSKTKTVWHILFMAFPDHGVPEDEDRMELLNLIKLSSDKNSSPQNPRTIHCSAGVGRSGTFIALEYLLAQLHSGAVAKAREGEDMVYDVVNQLREQRMMMVQTESQYQFLYEVLSEEFIKKQAMNYSSGQPSPKLRKLAGGIKVALLEERDAIKGSSRVDVDEIRADEGGKEDDGQDPHAI